MPLPARVCFAFDVVVMAITYARIRSSAKTAQLWSTMRLVPSGLILAEHSGQSTRMESNQESSFSRKRRAVHIRLTRVDWPGHRLQTAELSRCLSPESSDRRAT